MVPDLDRRHEAPSRYVWIRIKRASDQKHSRAIGHVDLLEWRGILQNASKLSMEFTASANHGFVPGTQSAFHPLAQRIAFRCSELVARREVALAANAVRLRSPTARRGGKASNLAKRGQASGLLPCPPALQRSPGRLAR